MVAHIVGIPVEETALGFAPVAALMVFAAGLRLRSWRDGQIRRAGR